MQHAVRHRQWKLVRMVDPDGKARNELYKLDEDPAEAHDLAAAQPKLVAELAAKIDEWRKLYPAGGVRSAGAAPKTFKTPPDWTSLAK